MIDKKNKKKLLPNYLPIVHITALALVLVDSKSAKCYIHSDYSH